MKPLTKSLIMMIGVLAYIGICFLTTTQINLYLGMALTGVGFLLLLKKIEDKTVSPIIPEDKANHFIYGSVITALSMIVFNHVVSFGICFGMAAAKELFDKYDHKPNSNPDFYDFLWTLLGGLLSILISYL